MGIKTMIVPLSICLLVAACGTVPFTGGSAEKVVKRIPDKAPGWLNDGFIERDGYFHVVGRAVKVDMAAKCIYEAKLNAYLEMAKSLEVKARSEFADAARGVDAPADEQAPYLDSLAEATGNNLEMKGILPDATYQERVMVGELPHPDYFFNCEITISFPLQNYQRARAAALSSFKDNAKGPVAEAIAKAADAKFGGGQGS
jgi:hypothetical protein